MFGTHFMFYISNVIKKLNFVRVKSLIKIKMTLILCINPNESTDLTQKKNYSLFSHKTFYLNYFLFNEKSNKLNDYKIINVNAFENE